MSLLMRRRAKPHGRHHADSPREPKPRKGPVALTGRHTAHPEPRVQIVASFTGWGALARMCAEAAENPVVDTTSVRPAASLRDPSQTQPFPVVPVDLGDLK